MKEKIIACARSLGISDIGFTSYEGKTAIVCLFAYPCMPKPDANLSLYTYGKDYHAVIAEILTSLGKQTLPDDFSVHADIGPSVDRHLARLAGLGFYGKNGMLIHPKLGSFFFIGWIHTSISVSYDTPIEQTCLGCNQCYKACPGGALSEDSLDITRCASAISQKKGELTWEEKAILIKSNLIFGCDRCQTVCPHNRDIQTTYLPDFTENQIFRLSLAELSSMTNRTFSEKYKDRAFSWRGKGVLIRNLEIISNAKKE